MTQATKPYSWFDLFHTLVIPQAMRDYAAQNNVPNNSPHPGGIVVNAADLKERKGLIYQYMGTLYVSKSGEKAATFHVMKEHDARTDTWPVAGVLIETYDMDEEGKLVTHHLILPFEVATLIGQNSYLFPNLSFLPTRPEAFPA